MDRMEESDRRKAAMRITSIFYILSILKSCYFFSFSSPLTSDLGNDLLLREEGAEEGEGGAD